MAILQGFKLDEFGDLAIIDGDFALIEDAEYTRQQLEINYKLSKGDWFMDTSEGINYFDNENGIFGNRNLSEENRARLIEVGVNTDGVKELISFDVSIDNEGTLYIKISYKTIFSELIESIEITA